jgi:hypothetical protein
MIFPYMAASGGYDTKFSRKSTLHVKNPKAQDVGLRSTLVHKEITAVCKEMVVCRTGRSSFV